jgi:long-subunit acyl-CoA synthetase (AMP-forming)
VAFIDGLTDRKLTRAQVKDGALRLAGGLKKLGLKTGDVACIHGLNSLEWINAMLGCQAARVIASPANFA